MLLFEQNRIHTGPGEMNTQDASGGPSTDDRHVIHSHGWRVMEIEYELNGHRSNCTPRRSTSFFRKRDIFRFKPVLRDIII